MNNIQISLTFSSALRFHSNPPTPHLASLLALLAGHSGCCVPLLGLEELEEGPGGHVLCDKHQLQGGREVT